MPPDTPRLRFREFTANDLPALARLIADPQVMRFSLCGPADAERAKAVIAGYEASYRERGFGKWAVFERESDCFIGYSALGVALINGREEVELGYRLAREFWGRGYATEAARAVVEWAFTSRRMPYLIGFLEPENGASARVLRKCGMILQESTLMEGKVFDVYRIEAPAGR